MPRPPARARGWRTPAVIGVVAFLAGIGGTVVSCVSSIVSTVHVGTGSASPVDVVTADGWDEMVRTVDDQVGATDVVRVDARRRSTVVAAAVDDDPHHVQMFYYDGDVTASADGRRRAGRRTFDLTDVSGDVVEDAVDLAYRGAGVPDSVEPLLEVDDKGTGPRLTVTFPAETGAAGGYRLVVDASDGRPISQTG